jgi:iron complex transport system ATP-binding protein
MILDCQHVSIVKEHIKILDEINFIAQPGKVLAICGPNGAGKSTLLRVLAGAERPHRGKVILTSSDGRVWDSGHAKSIPVIAFVPEDTAVPFAYSMGRFPYHRGTPSQRDWAKVDAAIARAGIDDIGERSILKCSSGERRKAMLARAIATDSELMIFDELAANLDVRSQLDMLKVLRDLAHTEKKNIIVSIHELSLARSWADDTLILDDSKQIAFGEARDTLDPKLISDVFKVDAEVLTDSQGVATFSLRIPN